MEGSDLVDMIRAASNLIFIARQTWELFKRKGDDKKKRRKH